MGHSSFRSQNAYDAALVFENEVRNNLYVEKPGKVKRHLSIHQDDLKESRHYSTGSSLLRTMDTHIMESMWHEKVRLSNVNFSTV